VKKRALNKNKNTNIIGDRNAGNCLNLKRLGPPKSWL